jgi:hypothetical protein
MSSLLFESKHLQISYHQDNKYLNLVWKGFIPSEQFRFLACEIIRAVEKTKVTKILSDNTDWKIISPNDYSWAANHWFPKVEESGVRQLATVISTDYFNRYAERTVEGMTDVEKLVIKQFESSIDAATWLISNSSKKVRLTQASVKA